MDLPDNSQWDETTCDLAICSHPQCWAAVRRIERGRPQILTSPNRTPLDVKGKLPELTIVNTSDSCFQAKRLAHQQSPEFGFTKAHSLLCRSSKHVSKFQGRHKKDLPDKSLTNYTKRFPKESHKKLSVLNLNETQLPFSEDVRNMVVIWIPEESEKNVCLSEKTSPPTSQYGKKKKKLAEKTESSLGPPERQSTETGSKTPGVVVFPSSTLVHASEQLNSEVSVRARDHVIPQGLLKELFLREKNVPCPEMKIQLNRMKKSLPLEKSQPDSVISSKMFLTIHRLTLQRPVLRYPEHLKKFHHSLKKEGHRRQQQWQQPQERKEKTATEEQEAEKEAKTDLRAQNTLDKDSAALCGHSTLPGQKSDPKQPQQQVKIEGTILKQVSTERSRKDHSDKSLDFSPDTRSSKMSETEVPCEDISASVKTVLEVPIASQENIPGHLSESVSKTSWKPELKLLRILQATVVEEEESQPSKPKSEDSLDT